MTTLRFLRVQWDRVGAVVAAVVGIVMLGIGYEGVKGTAYIAGQVPYILSAGFGSISAIPFCDSQGASGFDADSACSICTRSVTTC